MAVMAMFFGTGFKWQAAMCAVVSSGLLMMLVLMKLLFYQLVEVARVQSIHSWLMAAIVLLVG